MQPIDTHRRAILCCKHSVVLHQAGMSTSPCYANFHLTGQTQARVVERLLSPILRELRTPGTVCTAWDYWQASALPERRVIAEVPIWPPYYLLVHAYLNLGPVHVLSTRRAGTQRTEHWLSAYSRIATTADSYDTQEVSRVFCRLTPSTRERATSGSGRLHLWVLVAHCSPCCAVEMALVPRRIESGPLDRDCDFAFAML